MATIQRPQELLPNPDPSTITTAQIEKSIDNLEAKITARVDGMEKAIEVFHSDLTRVPTLLDRSILGLRELLETRLLCMENDVKAVHDFLDTRGKDIAEQILHLRELAFGRIDKLAEVTDEKFVGVGSQFSERDTRTDQRAGDTKLAVDAAFAAAKEATAKIEAGFTKQIDSMTLVIDTKTENLNGRIADLKDQITSLATKAAVTDPNTTAKLEIIMAEMKALQTYRDTTTGHSLGTAALIGYIIGIGGFIFGLISAIGLIIKFMK